MFGRYFFCSPPNHVIYSIHGDSYWFSFKIYGNNCYPNRNRITSNFHSISMLTKCSLATLTSDYPAVKWDSVWFALGRKTETFSTGQLYCLSFNSLALGQYRRWFALFSQSPRGLDIHNAKCRYSSRANDSRNKLCIHHSNVISTFVGTKTSMCLFAIERGPWLLFWKWVYTH